MSDVVSVGGGLWSLVVDGTMVVFSSRHAAEELHTVITERDKEIERLRARVAEAEANVTALQITLDQLTGRVKSGGDDE